MKRKLFFGLLVCLLLLGCAEAQPVRTTEPVTVPTVPETTQPVQTEPPETTLPAPEPIPAQQLDAGVSFFRGREDVSWNLTDGKDVSRVDLSANQTLRIESRESFSGVYIRWEKIPESCVLQWDSGQKNWDSRFLHGFVSLEAPTAVLELIPGESCGICEIALFTEGELPSWVQVWQPPCEQADILVFPTHSDDDALFFGALIAHYAIGEGKTVQTAFLTDHWYEPIRNHERLDGLWEMGVRHYPILGSAKDYNAPSLNHAINYHKEDDILGWQVQQLRRFRPLAVVGHDVYGEYGHQQHILNTMYLIQAVELAADETQYPESAQQYGVWDTPKLYLHLYDENAAAMDVNTPLAGDPAGRTAFEIAVDAYGHHKSQHQYYFQVQQGREYPQTDCTWFGLYRSKVGPDTGWDIMEHTKNMER